MLSVVCCPSNFCPSRTCGLSDSLDCCDLSRALIRCWLRRALIHLLVALPVLNFVFDAGPEPVSPAAADQYVCYAVVEYGRVIEGEGPGADSVANVADASTVDISRRPLVEDGL